MVHYQNYLYQNVQRGSELLSSSQVTSLQWLILQMGATLPKENNLVSTAQSETITIFYMYLK
jgi:hypothetical protein